MKKIPTLFKRDEQDRRYVTDEVTPGCEWVLAGEGVATRKYDGTCVMLDEHGQWWARREVKPGKVAPADFQAEEFDEVTGKTVGWEPLAQSPFAKFHAEALAKHDLSLLPGTYELCGPKVNGNPEGYPWHVLIGHRDAEVLANDQPPAALVSWYGKTVAYEGIVWHHPDGRMAKLKARDLRAS